MLSQKKRIFNYQNAILLASIIPIVIFGFLTYENSKKTATEATFEYLQSINEQATKDIESYFDSLEFNMNELTKNISFLEEQAKNNILNIQTLQKSNIKNHYLASEITLKSLAKKDIFQYIYSFLKRGKTVDSLYYEKIKTYKDELRLKNILMLRRDGKILYSSDDQKLVGTYAKDFSSTCNSFFTSLKTKKTSRDIHILNFSLENDSKKYTQYMIKRFDSVDGYIALEINQKNLQDSISNVVSLGKSAETYLTYKNNGKTYLATDRYVKSGKVGDEKSGKYINRGFLDKGIDIKYGSLGNIELVGYSPVQIQNIVLSMQTTVDYIEVISPIINKRDYFQQFVKDHNYHNIMIVGPKGDIFYSVTKESDYKTNIFSDKYANSHLLKAVNQVIKTKKYVLTDLAAYSDCSKGLAQFALAPILSADGSIQSIVIIQLEENTLSDILKNSMSNYASDESYLVGQDYRLRSNSILLYQTYTTKNSFENSLFIKNRGVKECFRQGNSDGVVDSYRGVKVLLVSHLLEYMNFQWAVVTEVDSSEIEDMLIGLRNNIFFFLLISLFVAFVVMIIITNEKKKQDKKLYYTATHDNLTGLPNRKFALEFLSFILAKQKRAKTKGAVLFMDLDKFKFINDSYGHDAGDMVLIEIASRLKSILRAEDLVARLGGDEFIVILNDFKLLSDIDRLCVKLIKEVSKTIEDKERGYEVGMSIGIATFPEDSTKAEDLLQFADTAMFRTKANGRNSYTYYSKEMTEKSLQVSRVEEELKHAIVNNELELHFQPQIDLEKEKIIGVEVLVRWRHPVDGLIMPDKFIPIAEESNLIVDLGYWVTYESCKTFLRWKDLGIDLEYIAVNMSTKQLQSASSVAKIIGIFEELNFDPKYLELEITENTLISDFESTLVNINMFKEMGIQFSIDDFGTGYSSLSYLKSLPISTLKIDREFVKDIIVDKDDRAIVKAIIAMGHTLNYRIVAEGAETREEVILLKYLDCDVVQGYYYSKPLQEAGLLSYIENKEWIKDA